MQRTVSRINDFLSAISGWLMLAMMAILLIDIVWRTFFNPLQGMAEYSVFVMMIVIYLGFSRCEEHGDHVRLEFLVEMAGGRLRAAMIVVARILAAVTVAALFYAVITDAWTSYLTNDSLEGMISLPIWPTKFVMVVGMSVFVIQTVLNVFRPTTPDDLIPPEARGEGYE